MKKIFQIIVTIIFSSTINAQGLNWNWAVAGCSAGEEKSESIVVDAAGNRYVLGNFRSPSISFATSTGTITLTNASSTSTSDIFLLKYDNTGSLLWARSYGNTGDDIAKSMTIDSFGFPYITGYFDTGILQIRNNSKFKPLFISLDITNGSAFAIKFNTNGLAIWANNFGINSGIGTSIKINAQGDLYITGKMFNSINYFEDIFLRKIDYLSGLLLWETYGKTTIGTFQNSNSVDVDASGNAYITGSFESDITFENTNPLIPGINLLNNKNTFEGMFVAVYDSSGIAKSAVMAQNTLAHIAGTSIRVDNSGNIFVAGFSFAYSPNFGNNVKYSTNSSKPNVFVVKYNQNLSSTNTITAQWARNMIEGCIHLDDQSLNIDHSGFVYIGVNDEVVKLDNNSGTKIMTWKYNSSSTPTNPFEPSINSVFIDNNDIYCSGFYKGPNVSFGPLPVLNNNGLEDFFAARIGYCAYPSPPTVTAVRSCFFNTKRRYTLTANLTNPLNFGVANWYSSLTSTTPLGNPYLTPVINTHTDYYAEVVNACGKSTRVKVTLYPFDCPPDEGYCCDHDKIGNNQLKQSEFDIHPNPSNGIFNINTKDFSQVTIEVYNQLGNLIKRVYINDKNFNYELDLSAFAKGIYMLNMIKDDQKLTRKLILQ
jgi:hypothetical protein